MGDADESLRSLAKRLRAFGQGDAATKAAAPLVEAAIKATAAAGTDPYGEPWRPKKDGGRALPDAADALAVTSHGKVILITVSGGEAAQTRYGVRRMLPKKRLPRAFVDAIKEGARLAWKKAMAP